MHSAGGIIHHFVRKCVFYPDGRQGRLRAAIHQVCQSGKNNRAILLRQIVLTCFYCNHDHSCEMLYVWQSDWKQI
jgi:hypothetical protein